MTTKVIYFLINGKEESAEFNSDDDTEDVRETFRAAAEAGPSDILKLYNTRKNLVNISPKLPENTPSTRYKLEVVAADYSRFAPYFFADKNGLLPSPSGSCDVSAIDQRLSALEKKVYIDNGEMPETFHDLKAKVDNFKEKLESVAHLSWLGLSKDLSIGMSQPFWHKKSSPRKMEMHHKKVYERFMKFTKVHVSDEVRRELRKQSFDNWQWDDPEMLILLRQMYIDLNLITKLNIDMNVLHEWLYEVYRNYNIVPFHNFKHCFMVAQMMYGLTWLIDLPSKLDTLEIFTLLTSAICHDLDHPGYNNAYQINAKTELALRYNDISPLENHHCAVAFDILKKDKCNITRDFSRDQFKRFRDGMIRCILATDMAKHNEILNSFKSIIPHFDFNDKEHKSVLMMVLMKVSDISNEARPLSVAMPWLDCLLTEFFNQLMMILIKVADISNEARPMAVAEPWLDCLLQEFFNQSDLEKLEGLPVAPFMDREKVSKSSSQIGFIKFVLLPLFETVGKLFPQLESAIIEPVRDALAYYTEMQRALEEEKAKKDSLADSMEGDKNGLLPAKLNNGSDEKEPGGMKTLTLGHSLTLARNNSSNLRRGSTTRLTSKHSMELETSPS
ncbi:high affinity cGMP-specific 3',5'-cyclic phosphodiesterase 9A-like [Physella acuta]|uniref:high affinity cGMP-specific 3',5'-cyclic phosphodiesterase 9A-like n=1 Tax=Physella acuta TaxID=109671 RepID=UPI0027DB1B3C|nr:high affinity cGMP-specific 3',5'-cyclic phosphodiesterase 9A-like [Physella acuta]